MLMSGKSGTMLPITACSSTGQLCHEGSCAWQRCDPPVGARPRGPPAPSPRQPSTQPKPTARRAPRQRGTRCRPAGMPATIASTRRTRLGELVEAHVDARGHVARGAHDLHHAELRRRGRPGGRTRRSKGWPLARPASPVRPRPLRELGRHASRGDEAVLQPRVLVEDARAMPRPRWRSRAPAQRAARAPRLPGSVATPPGTIAIHQEAMAEGLGVRAQPVFLQPHELREGEAERRVVAERAQVAQVVGDALALEQQRAQPARPRRAPRRPSSDSAACA